LSASLITRQCADTVNKDCVVPEQRIADRCALLQLRFFHAWGGMNFSF
jgi:hypothetical protein